MKVVLDLNVFIDMTLKRTPHDEDAKRVWDSHQGGLFAGLMTATEVTNLFYIMRRAVGSKVTLHAVDLCLAELEILPVTHADLIAAAAMPGKDFEDNVVIACAEAAGADCIVTRDQTGFVHSPVPPITPGELLMRLKS